MIERAAAMSSPAEEGGELCGGGGRGGGGGVRILRPGPTPWLTPSKIVKERHLLGTQRVARRHGPVPLGGVGAQSLEETLPVQRDL